jgi:hypothetical protein
MIAVGGPKEPQPSNSKINRVLGKVGRAYCRLTNKQIWTYVCIHTTWSRPTGDSGQLDYLQKSSYFCKFGEKQRHGLQKCSYWGLLEGEEGEKGLVDCIIAVM